MSVSCLAWLDMRSHSLAPTDPLSPALSFFRPTLSFLTAPTKSNAHSWLCGRWTVSKDEWAGHIMCVWKDRNLSLTSHRQLSTYSFEVYLVVLFLLLLLFNWVVGPSSVWSFISAPCPTLSQKRLTERLNETCAAEFVSLSTLLHFAFGLSSSVLCWCSWHCRII